jgi:hypothetical protein
MADLSGGWRPAGQIAVIASVERVAIVNLSTPQLPPQILAGTAAAVWAELEEGASTRSVVDGVVSRFAGPPDVIAAEVLQFLHRLEAEGLIVRER